MSDDNERRLETYRKYRCRCEDCEEIRRRRLEYLDMLIKKADEVIDRLDNRIRYNKRLMEEVME